MYNVFLLFWSVRNSHIQRDNRTKTHTQSTTRVKGITKRTCEQTDVWDSRKRESGKCTMLCWKRGFYFISERNERETKTFIPFVILEVHTCIRIVHICVSDDPDWLNRRHTQSRSHTPKHIHTYTHTHISILFVEWERFLLYTHILCIVYLVSLFVSLSLSHSILPSIVFRDMWAESTKRNRMTTTPTPNVKRMKNENNLTD